MAIYKKDDGKFEGKWINFSLNFGKKSVIKRKSFRFGETTMHIAKECINFYNVAFSVPYNSKYKDVFNKKIGQILEAGLTRKYLEIELDKVARTINSAKSKAINTPLSIIHLRPPLLLLLILLGISLLVFCIECACGK